MRRRFHLVVLLIAGIAACARAHADPSVGEVGEGSEGGASAEVDGGASAATGTDVTSATTTTITTADGGAAPPKA